VRELQSIYEVANKRVVSNTIKLGKTGYLLPLSGLQVPGLRAEKT
jgi:hypothetical protein